MAGPPLYYEDGLCHGELDPPSETEFDQTVYPERPRKVEFEAMPMDMPYEQWQSERERRMEAQQAADERRDREFRMTEENVTGEYPGPPRTVR